MPRPVFLSKSRLMSARQCHKRLYLEVHRKDLAEYSPATESAFRKGHEIGDIARHIYGTSDATFIPFDGGLQHALAKTRRLLNGDRRAPIFEATLQYQGVLVRLDVLLPDGDGWRIVEVKASTSVKAEHYFDCAIQAWVFTRSGYRMRDIFLAHVDNDFVYDGDADYRGLLREEDVQDDVDALLPSVGEWVAEARGVVAGEEPATGVGKHCFAPYECPFVNHCWPQDTDYPLLGLGGRATKEALGRWIAEGIVDVRDIPSDRLNETQQRIQRITRSGRPELLPGAATHLARLDWPRYYLDFETVSLAVPRWKGTRPYEPLPFQWSCHYETVDGTLSHAEFLDTSGEPPMRRFAESLIRVLGKSGPVLVYSSFEASRLRDLVERYPDLAEPLHAIIGRLDDLMAVAKSFYYHPDMHGSWSIKAILPTVAPDLDYGDLDGVQDGSSAADAYAEAIDPGTDGDRREQIRAQLLAYCRYDTLAMVRLAHFFAADQSPRAGVA